MLLHLDVKEPGLEAEIDRLLTAADAWDHVVAVNTANAPVLAKDARLKLLAYKAPGLFDGRLDVDPAAVRAALARPGQMIIVDDPRVAAQELKRSPSRPVPLPGGLRVAYPPTLPREPPPGEFVLPPCCGRSASRGAPPEVGPSPERPRTS